MTLASGMRAKICGLNSRKDLNAREVVLEKYVDAKGRWACRTVGVPTEGILVRPDNLVRDVHMAFRCGARVILSDVSSELDGKEAEVLEIDESLGILVRGVLDNDGVGEQRLPEANLRLSTRMGSLLDGTHELSADYIHEFADWCGLKAYSAVAPVCKVLAAESAAWPVLRDLNQPFGRYFSMTPDEEVICQAQFCGVGRPAVFPAAYMGKDLLCFPETRVVWPGDANFVHADTGPPHEQARVGQLNFCTPRHADIAFVARRGVLSSPMAVAKADLHHLFVADAGRSHWTNRVVDGKYETLVTVDPPPKILRLTFDSIDSLLAGEFTSTAFGEGKVTNPVDIAVDSTNNTIFVLDRSRRVYDSSGDCSQIKIKQVAKFDINTLEYTGSFGSNVLVNPGTVAVLGSHVFVSDAGRVISFAPDGKVLRIIFPDYGPQGGYGGSPGHIGTIAVVRQHLVVMMGELMEIMTPQGSTRQVMRFPTRYRLMSHWSDVLTGCSTQDTMYVVTGEEGGERGGSTEEGAFVLEVLR